MWSKSILNLFIQIINSIFKNAGECFKTTTKHYSVKTNEKKITIRKKEVLQWIAINLKIYLESKSKYVKRVERVEIHIKSSHSYQNPKTTFRIIPPSRNVS